MYCSVYPTAEANTFVLEAGDGSLVRECIFLLHSILFLILS